MKLAIIGSRVATDYEVLKNGFLNYFSHRDITTIVSGGARGADTLGKTLAHNLHYTYLEFLPDWDGLGKKAGFIRNEQIINACDEVLALWDGVSKGTAHSLSLAKKAKKNTVIIYV